MLRRSKAPGDPGFEAECRDYQETIRNFVFAHCDIELRDAIGWHSRFSLYAGLRVGEIAALKIRDVATSEGEIRHEIKLTATQTKGSLGRTVVLSGRVRSALGEFLKACVLNPDAPLIA
jgi:integrase